MCNKGVLENRGKVIMPKKVKAITKGKYAICGKELTITVYEDGAYEGSHYFGKIPIYSNKCKEIGKERLGDLKATIIDCVIIGKVNVIDAITTTCRYHIFPRNKTTRYESFKINSMIFNDNLFT